MFGAPTLLLAVYAVGCGGCDWMGACGCNTANFVSFLLTPKKQHMPPLEFFDLCFGFFSVVGYSS